jgi:hypothetical protein
MPAMAWLDKRLPLAVLFPQCGNRKILNTDDMSEQTSIGQFMPGNTGNPGGRPVRSRFQTHSAALKSASEISWMKLRSHAVQQLTGVALWRGSRERASGAQSQLRISAVLY